jgi:hypothetical protein
VASNQFRAREELILQKATSLMDRNIPCGKQPVSSNTGTYLVARNQLHARQQHCLRQRTLSSKTGKYSGCIGINDLLQKIICFKIILTWEPDLLLTSQCF